MTPGFQKALTLGRLALQFSRVERVTRHEDGIRPETDSDHTIMLALVAGELAHLSSQVRLNRELVVAFAVVHDFIETYTGDVQTLILGAAGRAVKREREKAAENQLAEDLGTESTSWVVRMYLRYEEQHEPEARFVRLLDKVMPKITHAFNGCVAARALTDYPGFLKAHHEQHEQLSKAYPEFPEILALLRESMDYAQECWALGPTKKLSGDPS